MSAIIGTPVESANDCNMLWHYCQTPMKSSASEHPPGLPRGGQELVDIRSQALQAVRVSRKLHWSSLHQIWAIIVQQDLIK